MPKKKIKRREVHKRFDADVAKEILKLMKKGFVVQDGGHYILIFCPCPMDAKPTRVSKSKSRANLSRVRAAASKCPDHPELQT